MSASVPPPSQEQKTAQQEQKSEAQSAANSSNSLGKKYSIRQYFDSSKKKEEESKTYYDLRNYKNFRKPDGNGADGSMSPRSYYMSNHDFLFAETFPSLEEYRNIAIQPIIFNEFQPLAFKDLVLSIAFSAAEGGLQAMDLVPGLGTAAELAAGVVGRELSNFATKAYSENPEKLYSAGALSEKVSPMRLVAKMFERGKWLNTFELPFFGNTYLEANNEGKWNAGGMEALVQGGKLSNFMKNQLSIDFPTQPTFQVGSMGNAGYKNITMDFYLINRDTNWLIRNFQFLHAFYAGTQWVQLTGGIIKGSNVYNVLCPGRFNFLWASIGSTITFEGKLRKNIDAVNFCKKSGIGSIDDDMLWPDAWKLTINIKDLTPNNFNTYINYFIHGYQNSQFQLAKVINNNTGLENLTGVLKKGVDIVSGAVSKVQKNL